MKIRYRFKCCAMLGAVAVSVGTVGIVSWQISDGSREVRAIDDGDESLYVDTCCDLDGTYDWPEDETVVYKDSNANSGMSDDDWLAPVGAGALPSSYDTREEYGYARNKNQRSEGICAQYALTTTLEYYLRKNFNDDTEISPKHLDYQMVSAGRAYEESGVQNIYHDQYVKAHPGDDRKLGAGAGATRMLTAISNPLAMMSEANFIRVLKNKDSRINSESIIKYEDIWGLDNHKSILTDRDGNGEDQSKNNTYTVKQNFAAINDPDNTNYMATQIGVIRYLHFGAEDPDRDAVVNTIKDAIYKYGAVYISTHIDTTECAYKKTIDSVDVYTLIDRGNCDDYHGMAIVGWDDKWEYYDGETLKQGAFVLQNSWGESVEKRNKWHLSYDSYFYEILYFKSVERYGVYDKIYGPADYLEPGASPANDEHVFKIDSDGVYRRLKGFTFNEYYNSADYDIYLSLTGKDEDFDKIDSFTAYAGMTKYNFKDEFGTDSDYAIKLKKKDGEVEDKNRNMGILNVFTDDAWRLKIDIDGGVPDTMKKDCVISNSGSCSVKIPIEVPTRADYYLLGYADTPNATVAKYQPGSNIVLSANKTIYAIWADGGVEWQSDGAEYTIGSGNDMIIRIDYPMANFVKLMIDNRELDNTGNEKYKLESGSTIITVYNTYLDTIEPGDHILQAVYDNGTIKEMGFTVRAPEADDPGETDDDEDLPVPDTTSIIPDTDTDTPSVVSDTDDLAVPDTGSNMRQDDNSIDILTCIVPVAMVILAGGLYMKRRSESHRRFEQ